MEVSRGAVFMILAAFFFSLMAILVKASGTSIPPQELVVARSIVVLVITGYLLKRRGLSLWGNNKKLLFLRGLFGFCGLSAFFYTLTSIPIADSVTLHHTNPLFTALLATYILQERSSKKLWSYFLLAFAGILLIVRPGFSYQTIPALIGLGGAFCAALAYNTVRKLRYTDNHLSIVFYLPAVSILFGVPWVIPTFVMPQGWEWLMLLGVGIFTQIAQIFMTKGLHYETAAKATNVSYIGVVFSTIWGILIFAEIPDWRTLIGAAFVIFAIIKMART